MATLSIDRLPRNATPGEVLRFACKYGKIEGKAVGRIAFLGSSAVVTVPDAHASRLVAALDGATFRDFPVRVRLTSAVPRGDRAELFDRLARLLSLEADAERKEMKRRAALGDAPDGTTITKLVVKGEDLGLGGRTLLTLTRGKQAAYLPPNRLQPGAPALLTQTGVPRPVSFRGVVSDRQARSITVALDESDDAPPDDASWRLDLSPDEVSRQRQLAALHRAAAAEGDRLAALREVLLGEVPAKFGVALSGPSPLNESQAAAVEFALAAADVAVIHGPPGTGKTTTVVELIRRAVAAGGRVLACAPSNAAVDNLLEKLLGVGLEPVRIGHPARVAEALRGRVLDALVEKHPEARQARKYAKEAQALLKKANKWTKDKPVPGEKQALRAEARQLLAVARRTEQTAVERVLAAATVVCGTLTGIDSDRLGQLRFDLVVIDEACQSTEPACWIPLLRADRVVLAGDPCQLPPTVISQEAAEGGLAVSLMERVMAACGPGVSRLLTIQYRMHAAVMAFPSAEFYGGELVADDSVAGHLLRDLPGVSDTPLTATPVQFIDTAGAGYDEEREAETGSRLNPQEAAVVVRVVRELLAAGLPADAIAVITPYNGQARLLRDELAADGVEVDSVDGFQGREKEAVVLSLVRSNLEGEIGFLADTRRTNVAVTRARRKLVVVGDSATLAAHDFYKRLLEHFEATDAYGSVWDEPS
jgi:ATP-dependent RNA/DNA helicase IGHMBP2